jgi:DNA-binding NtrC family response regulator
VRVVCATHRNLEQMTVDGEFREDLMFRINTFEIDLPSLRERPDDIGPLARYLLARFRPNAKSGDVLFADETLKALRNHSWPGNVRELANVVEHAAILCESGPIGLGHLPSRFVRPVANAVKGPHFKIGTAQSLRDIEMAAIHEALDRNAGNKPKAAEELGISLKTLYNKLNQANSADPAA